MRDFVRRIVENLFVAKDRDRVALVQYSGDTVVHFSLKLHSTKDTIISMIRTLRHKGGRQRNTGLALQYIWDNVLTTPIGSQRHVGVKQILIVISGGPSSDSVRQPLAYLLGHDILSYIISIDPIIPPGTALNSNTTFVFPISDFGELPDILLDVLFTLNAITLTGKLP